MKDHGSILVYYNFRCTGIIVIQSLPENEHATGKELFDDIISRYSEMVDFESHYREVYDREDFFQQMEHLIDAI
ncbi:hypothetical protein CLV42_12614 [Chitinophaga ginsengisoli]|uniref:Uncharacterized protein n=1 Tax=Chitinophaga ginsengisoli TaxID=363837 RepID=A0A2P8FDU6_9BACT|nr:hypothetical protein CLV42_12614 [Chitinophaga ginsengisoli]